jgi:hypothetical protein
MGELLPTVAEDGIPNTVTETGVACTLKHPLTEVTRLYCPVAATVAFEITGFCKLEVKPFGPVQAYTAFGIVVAVRFKVPPAQTGEFDASTEVGGVGSTVNVYVNGEAVLHPSGLEGVMI